VRAKLEENPDGWKDFIALCKISGFNNKLPEKLREEK
jgi:hypothetical protein